MTSRSMAAEHNQRSWAGQERHEGVGEDHASGGLRKGWVWKMNASRRQAMKQEKEHEKRRVGK